MRLSKLTLFAFFINVLIDRGYCYSFDQISKKIEERTLMSFLDEMAKEVTSGFLSSHSHIDKGEVIGAIERCHNAIDPRRKFGVCNNGLCVLLAYIIQEIQSKEDYIVDITE